MASAAFSVDIDQCENGQFPDPKEPCDWVNGNLGEQNSQYREGDSVAFRSKVGDAVATGNTFTIGYDSIEGGVHAYDYLTSWDETESGDPCEGITDCAGWPVDTEAIPLDPRLALGPDGVAGGGDDVTPIPGVFTCYGCTITAVSGYTHSDPDPNTTGTNLTTITITFDSSVENPVIAWGGHIASRADWRPDPNAVTDINGSPYHMRNGGAGGQQDRSLKASAVIFQAGLTIIKDATPEDGTNFGFTTTSDVAPNLSPSSFTLDDANPDDNDAFTNTQVFGGLENFTTYTITESTLPQGWSLADIVCEVVDANGGSITEDIENALVEINMKEGELVTCTFVNTAGASITINKNAVPNDEQDFGFTTTGDGLDPFSLDDDSGAVGEDGALANTTTFPISAAQLGTKTITEAAVQDWTLTGIECTKNGTALTGEDDLETRTATVTVGSGDTIVCDFTNTEHATLEVNKDAVPNDAEDFGFTSSDSGLSNFTLDDDAGAPGANGTFANTITFPLDTTQFGQKQITESAVSGWTLTDIACSENGAALTGEDDLANRRATVTVGAGDTIVCDFVNTQDATITVVKDAQPNDPQDFAFTTGASTGPAAFTGGFSLDDDGTATPLSDSQTFTFNANQLGAKTITEGVADGWTLIDIACTKNGQALNGEDDLNARTASVSIAAGDAVVCEFTNALPDVALTKQVDTDPNTEGFQNEPVQVGDSVTYTITLENTGLGTASLDKPLVDDFDEDHITVGTVNDGTSTDGGDADVPGAVETVDNDTIEWGAAGDPPFVLSANEVWTFTYDATIKGPFGTPPTQNPCEPGTLFPVANEVTIEELIADEVVCVDADPDLDLVKEVDTDLNGTFDTGEPAVEIGDTIRYRITVSNTGDAAGTVPNVTDDYDEDHINPEAIGGMTPPATTDNGSVITWNGPFTIAADDDITFVYEAVVVGSFTGTPPDEPCAPANSEFPVRNVAAAGEDSDDAIVCVSVPGTVTVIKRENGAAATGQFTFTLDGPDNFHAEMTTNDGVNGATLDFGELVPGEYTLCEEVPTGFGADLDLATPGDQSCVTFTLDPGEDFELIVDNIPCPEGGEITITKNIPAASGATPVSFTYRLFQGNSNTVLDTLVLDFTDNETQEQGTLSTPSGATGNNFRVTESESSGDKFLPNPAVTGLIIQPDGDPVCGDAALFDAAFAPTAVARVVKTEEPIRGQRRNATGRWTFYLIGPDQLADGDFVGDANNPIRTKKTNTKNNTHIVPFRNLLPGDYMLCEKFFRGWKSNLASKNGGTTLPNGDVCVEFTLDPNETQTFRVNNACPRGRTPAPGT